MSMVNNFYFPQMSSYTQMISIVMYIGTMLYVLFTYYNRANELVIEVRSWSARLDVIHFN